MTEPRFAKDKLHELTARDLTDALYGAIQSMIEQGKPDNIAFHYFLPAIPFGPELAAFMDLGTQPKPVDNTAAGGGTTFSANDLVRSAVNFSRMVDLIPTVGDTLTPTAKEQDDGTVLVDLNALISSGRTVSGVYKSVVDNCKVVNNGLSAADEAKLKALEAELYEDPPAAPAPPPPTTESGALDLNVLMNAGSLASVVTDTAGVRQPTVMMQNYLATRAAFEQIQQAELDVRRTVTAGDPNAGEILKRSRDRIEAAETIWKIQGRKDHVEAIEAQIDMLSQGGMPAYVVELRRRFAANQIQAAVFTTDDQGVGGLFEAGQFAALRPNGILKAPAAMTITLDHSNSHSWNSMSSSKVGGGGSFGLPAIGGFAVNASMKKQSEDLHRQFVSSQFSLSLELLQGIIDRPGISREFLESRAYTTVDPTTKQPLDEVTEIVQLSDGEVPPGGVMPLIPVTVYFAKSVTITSKALTALTDKELDEMSKGGGTSFFGFGAHGEKTTKTTTVDVSKARTSGELRLDGLFLIAIASRYLAKAPNPDFAGHPAPEDWI
jgi:hypothetical protein